MTVGTISSVFQIRNHNSERGSVCLDLEGGRDLDSGLSDCTQARGGGVGLTWPGLQALPFAS